MFLICSISVAISAGGLPWSVKADTRGKLISQSAEMYLVDFSKGVESYALIGKPSDYKRVLVKKSKCVKE